MHSPSSAAGYGPRWNLERAGDECDHGYVTGEGATMPVRTVVSNSFGFGGIIAVLAFGAVD